MTAECWMTIYCDEPSHATDPVGLFVRLPGDSPPPAAALQQHIELNRRAGVFIVSMMKRYKGSVNWMVDVKSVAGLARRGGGLQYVPDGAEKARRRYRLKCDLCTLTRAEREPGFSRKLTDLADQGIVAISLRALVES